MTQLPLEMPFRTIAGREDFILSECNAMAAASVEDWPNWPGGCRALNLVGPAGAGKSHLAAVWTEAVGPVPTLDRLPAGSVPSTSSVFILDHVEVGPAWDEEALFHLFSHCGAGGGLLLLSRTPVGQMDWRLPDLRSRMRAVNMARIALPDDMLLRGLFTKYFTERQMVAPPAMIDYLVNRVERSFSMVQQVGAALDRRSIAEKRPLSVALARDVLQDFLPL